MKNIFQSNMLSKKTCVISGGRTGIGLHLVKSFLECDAKIIILGRKLDKLKRKFSKHAKFNKKIFIYECDITDNEQIKNFVNKVTTKFKKIDILINNAGINFKIPAEKLLPNMLQLSIQTNLIGSLYLTVQIAKKMIKQKGYKKIINISAFTGGKAYPGLVHTHAGKAGVNALTKSLAIEWSRFNILVNAISPGQVLTRNFRHALTRMERLENIKDMHSIIEEYKNKELPLKRYVTENDIAQMALFLCSEVANNITGQIIEIDGGYGINNAYLLNQLKCFDKT